MSLSKYNQKRKFDETPEPKGGKSSTSGLRFVVQKHRATALHYDFRLEMEGVLKSWAVPKGPSLNPAQKRLAMMVEDHPFDYKDFEGIIPEGNYGAGEVIVWDRGTYTPIEKTKGREAQENALLKQLKEGSIKIVLKGKKLKGEFALVKTKGMGDNAWLLIKHKDKYSGEIDISKEEASVKSGKTLKDLANLNKERAATKAPKVSAAKNKLDKAQKKSPELNNEVQNNASRSDKLTLKELQNLLKKGKKSAFPKDLSPMLATLTDEPFDDDEWDFEVKWDGYRSIAFLNKGSAQLQSRNGNSFNEKFQQIYEAVNNWNINAIVDGEIVALGKDKLPHFNSLQNWNINSEETLIYYLFDILWLEGYDLTQLPLSDRKKILFSVIPNLDNIKTGLTVKGKGVEFFDAVKALGMEGIIAKKSESLYFPGDRSKNWLKIKGQNRQEVVILGYTKTEGSPKVFSSLILGVNDKGKLRYAGKVGTGFKDVEQKELMSKFKKLERKTSPIEDISNVNKDGRWRHKSAQTEVFWLKPELICEIHFTEVTADGIFRHPAYVALREDKKLKDVVMEKANNKIKSKVTITNSSFLNYNSDEQVKKINGHELKFTNLDKIYWPKDKFTKRDMLNYYNDVSTYILPYLKNRPQSLNRFPDGINGFSFYQKDVTGKVADWVEKYPYKADGDDTPKNYMLCNDKASLLYMANMGAIEINPWSSTIQKPDQPSWCILDIDPDKSNPFDQVIEVALTIKNIIDDLKIDSYCKTSGSTGLHIYIPLGQKYSFDQSQMLANWIAHQTNIELEDFTSIERMTKKRKGKIYIDYLQNRPGATLAAPYSLRPKPGATVSMPLHWEEVKKGLKMSDFTIENAIERIKSEGDIFKPVLGKGIELKKLLSNIKP